MNSDKRSQLNSNNQELSVIEKMTQVDRESTKVDFDKQSLSQDTEEGLKSIPLDVITEASKYSLSEIIADKLADRRSLFRKMSADEIMRWSNSLISKPLLKIPKELHEPALMCYKYLMSYMGDRKSTKKPLTHIKNHINATLWAAEDLKDEAYIQVIKQITEHKDYDRCVRGWKFLAVLASCYAPSAELYYSILNKLIEDVKTNTDVNLVKHANYILVRLSRTFECKRKQIPTDLEIKHIENMKPMMFPIYFFSETNTTVPTESYTTVKELKTSIMRKLQLNISRIPYYCLYEVCLKKNVNEERFLDDMDKIVDVTALWVKEAEMYHKNNEPIEFKIYLKIQLYYSHSENDIDTITMHYVQSCYDVIMGKFNLSENDVITLGAIQLMVNYGNSAHDEVNKNLEKNIEKYIPVDRFKANPNNDWARKIMDYFITQKVSNKLEAKLTYLEHLKQNSLWEAHQYYARYDKSLNKNESTNDIPENVIIGIKPTGITVNDLDRNEIIFFPYSKIVSWGVNNSIFVMVLPRKNNTDNEFPKYYFECNQTKHFQLLIESYTNLIVGKSITEIMNSAYNSIKRFDSMPGIKLAEGESLRSRSATQFKK